MDGATELEAASLHRQSLVVGCVRSHLCRAHEEGTSLVLRTAAGVHPGFDSGPNGETQSTRSPSRNNELKERRSAHLLQVRPFLGKDGSLHRADLKTDSAVDAGIKVDPVVVGSLAVLATSLIDAGDRAGIDAVGDAFAHIAHDRVGHDVIQK